MTKQIEPLKCAVCTPPTEEAQLKINELVDAVNALLLFVTGFGYPKFEYPDHPKYEYPAPSPKKKTS